jgi:hypothetical protein
MRADDSKNSNDQIIVAVMCVLRGVRGVEFKAAQILWPRMPHFPTDAIPTLSLLWGLSAPETLRAMPAVALLLVGPPRPNRSRGRSKT